MACLRPAEFRDHGEVDQDRLAAPFAERCDPYAPSDWLDRRDPPSFV